MDDDVQIAFDPERGRRIRTLRLPMSLKALATRVGVSGQTITAWEKGGVPEWENLERLAQALDTTTDYLLYGLADAEEAEREAPDLLGELQAAIDRLNAFADEREAAHEDWQASMRTWKRQRDSIITLQRRLLQAYREDDERVMREVEAATIMLRGDRPAEVPAELAAAST